MLRSFYNRFFTANSPCSEQIIFNLINAIISSDSVLGCRVIHGRVIKSVNYNNGFIGDRLVSVYVKLGCYDDAHKLFDDIPDKDLVSWNSLISGFSRKCELEKCLNAFYRMRLEMGFETNEVSVLSVISVCTNEGAFDVAKSVHGFVVKLGYSSEPKLLNSLIYMYGKFGRLDSAYRIFELTPFRNLVSWNSMIAIHLQNGFPEKAMCLFNLMRRDEFNPDQATMVALLQTCTELGVRKQVESIHGCILTCGLNSDITIETGLLSSYAKLGTLSESCNVFREMKTLDRIAWTAMLAGYAMHGCGRKTIELFELMVKKGVFIDHVTFTHLLCACSHSGLLSEGKKYFEVMSKVYRVHPRLDHYSCMVDLLGRSGQLKEAYDLILNMPIEPNSAVWGALVGACRVYGDIELAKKVAEKLIALDQDDPRNYVMLSNIYSAAGLWKEASNARALMKKRGVTQNPGCSFIEHRNKIHRFVVGDRSHPDSENIHRKLKELIKNIREAGFLPKIEYVLHDVEGDVKEDMINQHSEKLAISFGLLVTGANEPLIITKNLRICGDCHHTAKGISLIEKRTIIIRDSKRFHHFADGVCTCGDYW